MLYHGPVRVPEDARPGEASVVLELSPESTFPSVPTEIDVTLADEGNEQ
jgi:hypothetical protein